MTKKNKKSNVLSRRDFLKDAGLVVGGAAIGSTVLLAACAGETETKTTTVMGPGSTTTVTGPGSTTTVTGPGSTTTVTGPGSTVTSTMTQTVTGPAQTQTVTATKTVTATAQQENLITIMNPEGVRDPIIYQQLAPRLSTLEGKTIYLVDVNFTATWQLLEELEKLIKERIPSATVVRKIKAGSYAQSDNDLWDEVEEKADAFIMGTGH